MRLRKALKWFIFLNKKIQICLWEVKPEWLGCSSTSLTKRFRLTSLINILITLMWYYRCWFFYDNSSKFIELDSTNLICGVIWNKWIVKINLKNVKHDFFIKKSTLTNLTSTFPPSTPWRALLLIVNGYCHISHIEM